MIIPTTNQLRQADQHTIENEPITSIDLMERASNAFVSKFLAIQNRKTPVNVFCGTGNNGGDGLAVSRLLYDQGWEVRVFTIGNLRNASSDFQTNYSKIKGKISPEHLESADQFPQLDDEIIIDGIFGSGLSRPVEGLYGKLIDHINLSQAEVFSIDIASGLFAESDPKGHIIEPTHTITFQFPKLAFMQPNSAEFVGEWHVVDIGLLESSTSTVETANFYSEESDVRYLVPRRSKFMHKGIAGKLLLISGAEGKMGATILSARAAFRSGIGLLVVHAPGCGLDVLQTSIPEAMVSTDQSEKEISDIKIPSGTSAVALGPGIGTSKFTQQAVLNFFKVWKGPLVIDADGLNILSKNPKTLHDLPEGSVLTPHPKEFERLVGKWKGDYEKLDLLRNLCREYQLNVVLKGAFSAVCNRDGIIYFNSTGNSGMATAGSGDVLTGIIGGLIAQGLSGEHAARLGVYIHGLAGDLAVNQVGQLSLMSSDIIRNIPHAFFKISGDFLIKR